MNNPAEYEKYLRFIEDYFPKSPVVKFKKFNYSFYEIINQNINFIRLMTKLDTEASKERKQLYKNFELLNLRILYHWPSNDNFINKVIIRALVENILKIAVSYLNYKDATKTVDSLSFTEIKNFLTQKGIPIKHKDFYENMTNYFSHYSSDVHGSTIHQLSTEEYLVNIREHHSEQDFKKLLDVHKKINELAIPFFLKETSVTKHQLNSALLSSLLRTVGDTNYGIFYDRKSSK